MSSSYPPPHPEFVAEHQRVIEELRQAKARIIELEETLFRLTWAPPEEPHIPTNTPEPEALLLRLGWKHDKRADLWLDPHDDLHNTTLVGALVSALKRLLERASIRSWADKLGAT